MCKERPLEEKDRASYAIGRRELDLIVKLHSFRQSWLPQDITPTPVMWYSPNHSSFICNLRARLSGFVKLTVPSAFHRAELSKPPQWISSTTGAQPCQFKKHYNHMRRNVSGLIISSGERGISWCCLVWLQCNSIMGFFIILFPADS